MVAMCIILAFETLTKSLAFTNIDELTYCNCLIK